jgi:DNA-binding NarL/FixJ family response regulator
MEDGPGTDTRMARLLAATEELARTGSCELDLRSGERLWSAGLFRILDLAPGHTGPSEQEILGYVHPDDRARIEQLLEDVAQRPESVPEGGVEHRLRLVRGDGSVREVRTLSRIERDELRRPARWIGAVQDVTEQRPTGPDPRPLSEREIEVLRLAAEGMRGNEIAERLVLSPATVKTHLAHIYEKLGVGDRTAAVAKALRTGVIH